MTNEITPEPTTEVRVISPLNMSIGAGIALTGIWMAAVALTGFIFWGVWLSSFFPEIDLVDANGSGFWQEVYGFLLLIVIVWLNASPMIAATEITRFIIKGKK